MENKIQVACREVHHNQMYTLKQKQIAFDSTCPPDEMKYTTG